MSDLPKRSPVELEKEGSRFLRGQIAEQLEQPASFFTTSEHNLLKTHGTYQQDDRDKRQDLMRQGKEKAFSFMVRTKLPGGRLSAEQYLALDKFADDFANGTLRITTRQGIQFHGVLKGNLKKLIRKINDSMVTTLGACGDVVRNVCSCPAPLASRKILDLESYAKKISDLTLPKSRAYHEIWLDGEKVDLAKEDEPLYGKTYLPRKFKIAIAFPGDNCVDVFTHDLGLVAQTNANQELTGFNLLVGGGMGMTHNVAETYPILAKPLGFVSAEKIFQAVEAVIKIQRDNGNRANRKRARLKYLVEEKGIEWFAEQFRKAAGFAVSPAHPMDWTNTHDHTGWHKNASGKWFYGLFVENGRIKDEKKFLLRTALRKVTQRFKPEIFLTLHQNIIFDQIEESSKAEFEKILQDSGVLLPSEISKVLRWSMACPAMPTCGLAIAESERALPDLIRQLEKTILSLGLETEDIMLRMTGCPNGCARPYTSEIGLVGSGVDSYAVFLGANFEGTRLNDKIADKIHKSQVVPLLTKILEVFKLERRPHERFGDFCHRIGLGRLQTMISASA